MELTEDVQVYIKSATTLPFLYGVVERIRGIVSSKVFDEITSQPTFRSENSYLKTPLSQLHAAFPNIYYKLSNVELQRECLNVVQGQVERLRRYAYDVEDMLDMAATKQLMKKVKAKPELEEILMSTEDVVGLRRKLTNMSQLLEEIINALKTLVSNNVVKQHIGASLSGTSFGVEF